MEKTQHQTESILKDVIEVLHDGHKGFADLGKRLNDPIAKDYFLAESLKRQEFAGELLAELQKMGGKRDVQKEDEIGGTASGALHRTWADIKVSAGGGDHSLFVTAEQGEDAAKAAYATALESKNLELFVREILERQQRHIQASHDRVKAMRDAGDSEGGVDKAVRAA